MKTYTLYTIRYTLILAVSLAIPIGYSYAWDQNDNTDRLSRSSSSVFSPGYINAAQQQAMEISHQANQSKSWWDNLVDKIKNKMANDVTEDANTKVETEIKKKVSSGSGNKINATLVDSTKYDVTIGDGSSRIINGVMHYFIGFGKGIYGDMGKLQNAIDYAGTNGGGILIVKGGGPAFQGNLNIVEGVRLYGGYNDSGIRDIHATPTVIRGRIDGHGSYKDTLTEINGFTIGKVGSVFYMSKLSSLVLANNIISYSGMMGIYLANTSNTLTNNVFNSTGITIWGASGPSETTMKGNTFNSCSLNSYTGIITVRSQNNNFYSTAFSGHGIATTSSDDYFDQTSNLWGENITFNSPSSSANTEHYGVSIMSSPALTQHSTLPDDLRTAYGYRDSQWSSYNNATSGTNVHTVPADIIKNWFTSKYGVTNSSQTGLYAEILPTMPESPSMPMAALPITDADQDQAALKLANILDNPNEEQELVLDAIKSLLEDMAKIDEKASINPKLSEAENNMLQVVASCLLAQSIPDLFKEGDIANIRDIFKDLGQSRDKIMLDYAKSIRPYYTSMVKDIESNIAVLQLKGVLSKKLSEEELRKFEPKEIDKLINEIRKANDGSFEMEYILQQEGKYHRQYIDPSNKVLAEAMKKLMKSFAWKLNNALESKKR